MLRCFDGRRFSGQATVEAAFLIPVALAVILLAVQPGILLFNRMVMEAAAAEGCRVAETLEPGCGQVARDYVLRRLEAVPCVDVFHAGQWTVEVSGDSGAATASVRIVHEVRPLPLAGMGLGFAGSLTPGGLYRQEAFREEPVRDTWVMGSELGSDPAAWVERWEEAA